MMSSWTMPISISPFVCDFALDAVHDGPLRRVLVYLIENLTRICKELFHSDERWNSARGVDLEIIGVKILGFRCEPSRVEPYEIQLTMSN
jgi:hypothetical protein